MSDAEPRRSRVHLGGAARGVVPLVGLFLHVDLLPVLPGLGIELDRNAVQRFEVA